MESPIVSRLPHQNTMKRTLCNSKQYKKNYIKNINDFEDSHFRKCYHGYINDFDDGHFGYQYCPQSIRVPIKADIPDRVMISSRINAKTPSPGLSPNRAYDPLDYCQMSRYYLNSPLPSYPSRTSPARSIPSYDRWTLDSMDENSTTAVVTSAGIISLMISKGIQVDLTVDGAIRILNSPGRMAIAVNVSGKECAFLHPVGRMRQYDNKIEIVGISATHNHKFAKMWSGGISFTTDKSSIVFLIDPAGTRSTKDTFSDLLASDFSENVFFSGSQHGAQYLDECVALLNTAYYKMKADGSEVWIINNILIQKTVDNLVSVNRGKNEIQIKTNVFGKGRLTTSSFHCTASSGEQKHLFVKSDDKRMHYDGSKFVVRNAAQSAGFNKDGQFTVY
ncbi:uncharacterized protein LOC135835156 isoform X2 [Planococcus citri]|uniref:uncharacterized protein LOC135835156 isoform X2 n=1 Tax=Planococcus citri TaxID=170843 RepID=UPI0031F8F98D